MNNELQSISEKLQQAARSTSLQRRRERVEAEQLMAAIEAALQERKEREEGEIEQAKEKGTQLSQYLEDTVRGMGLQSSREAERVAALREQLEDEIGRAQRDHQERVQQILQLSEEKISAAKEQLEKKTKAQREKMELYLNGLSKKLLAIQKQFREQSEARKEGQQRMRTRFYDQLQQLKEGVERERQRRVSAERRVQAMSEQIEEKLGQEVAGLGARCRKNNEAMLRLIELACLKMQERAE